MLPCVQQPLVQGAVAGEVSRYTMELLPDMPMNASWHMSLCLESLLSPIICQSVRQQLHFVVEWLEENELEHQVLYLPR